MLPPSVSVKATYFPSGEIAAIFSLPPLVNLRDLEFLERKGLRHELAVGEDADSNRKSDKS